MPTAAYINGYQPHAFSDFSGGLNLRDKADTIGDREAIDVLNVHFSERGAIRQRDGYIDLTPTDLTNRVDSLAPFYTANGSRQLIAGCGTRLEALDRFGVPVAARTGLNGGPWTFTRFSDPVHEYLYAANGADTLQRWDGATWASGAAVATVDGVAGRAMPKAGAVTVTAMHAGNTSGTNASNRLVATAFGTQTTAGPGGTQSTPSRVYFSDPGFPERWQTDGAAGTGAAVPPYSDARGRNWIDLTPGDGERIQAAVTWRELVFIFKETKFFVIWGESTTVSADSTTVVTTFHVREIVNAVGLASPQAVAVGRDGVYFMNRRGVYRTNGSDPVLLSEAVSPMWTQDPEVYFRSSPINLAQLDQARMLWHMERLYFAVPTGAATVNDRVLVYDTQREWWSLYDLPAAALASFRSSAQPEVHFGYATPLPQRVGHLVLGQVTDRGAVITSRWRSGWGDYNTSQIKTLRETKAWGDGIATVTFSTDFNYDGAARLPARFRMTATDWLYWRLAAQGGSYTNLTGRYVNYTELTGNQADSPVINGVLLRSAVRGTVFSTEFSDHPDAPAWTVHRIARHMREIREPSVIH